MSFSFCYISFKNFTHNTYNLHLELFKQHALLDILSILGKKCQLGVSGRGRLVNIIEIMGLQK